MTGKYWNRAWSLVGGCTPCSPGCDHCWSAAIASRFCKHPDLADFSQSLVGRDGNNRPRFTGIVTPRPDRLDIPLKTRKPTVFAVWNDLFHEDVPDEFIVQAFNHMPTDILQPCKHTYLVLTKRAKRMLEFFAKYTKNGTEPWPNVWLGVTVCNQAEADEKIPLLLRTPAAHRWVSVEPMLGKIVLRWTPYHHQATGETYRQYLERKGSVDEYESLRLIDAVILGGETLSNKAGRPMKTEWAESIVTQCDGAGVPVFVKQLHVDGKVSKDMAEWPTNLQRRDLPWLQKDK